MTWEGLSIIAETVGAAGVIASLIFLALETRRNTKTMRASLSNDSLSSIAALNDMIFANPELRRVVSKATDESLVASDFDKDEWDAIIYGGRAIFLRLEGTYSLYRQGLIEDDVWELKRAIGSGMIKLPIWRRYWEQDKSNGIFSSSFIDEIERASDSTFRTPTREDDT
jgi:hypothetical protein